MKKKKKKKKWNQVYSKSIIHNSNIYLKNKKKNEN